MPPPTGPVAKPARARRRGRATPARAAANMPEILNKLLILIVILTIPVARAMPPPEPWMRADWTPSAPRFHDSGLDPQALGNALGHRLLAFRWPAQTTVLPGAGGPHTFANAQYVSAVARLDIPARQGLRLLHDFDNYKNLFPLMTESSVEAQDGRNVITRNRIELPLPVASFKMDFRVKNRIEDDGSVASMLVDGQASSALAMLGGASESLRDQPSLSRAEIIPLDAGHCLIVFTWWERYELTSWIALMVQREYPEIVELTPYIAVAGALEAIREKYSFPDDSRETTSPPEYSDFNGLQNIVERYSAWGPVVILHPEPGLHAPGSSYLRYVSVAGRLHRSLDDSRRQLTSYSRLPEALPEIRKVSASPQGQDTDLALQLHIGLSVIGFPLDLGLHNHWNNPARLDFTRTSGDLARLYGSCEWQAEGQDTLLIATSADSIDQHAPWLLGMFHHMIEQVPYAGEITLMVVQEIALLRLEKWVGKG